MAIQLDGFDLANEYISGPLQGELYIAEKNGIPTLMGNLNLENMKFKIPLSLELVKARVIWGLMLTYMLVKCTTLR